MSVKRKYSILFYKHFIGKFTYHKICIEAVWWNMFRIDESLLLGQAQTRT